MVVLTLTSGHWLESSVHSARESDYQEDDAYLVMYSDDGRSGSTKGNLLFSNIFFVWKILVLRI